MRIGRPMTNVNMRTRSSMANVGFSLGEVLKSRLGFLVILWYLVVGALTQPTECGKYVTLSIMVALSIIWTTNPIRGGKSYEEFFEQFPVRVMCILPIAFLSGTVIKNMLTNKGSAKCFSISVLLVLFSILCDFNIKRHILLKKQDPTSFLICLIIEIFLFILIVCIEYLKTEVSKLNTPERVTVTDKLQRVKTIKSWLGVFGINFFLGFKLLDFKTITRANDVNLDLFSFSYTIFVLWGLREVIVCFFMLSRGFEGYLQYNKLQKEKILINTAMCLIQWIILFEYVFITNRQIDRSLKVDSWNILACWIIFLSASVVSLINTFRTAEENEAVFSKKEGAYKARPRSLFWIFPLFLVEATIALTGCIVITSYYNFEDHIVDASTLLRNAWSRMCIWA